MLDYKLFADDNLVHLKPFTPRRTDGFVIWDFVTVNDRQKNSHETKLFTTASVIEIGNFLNTVDKRLNLPNKVILKFENLEVQDKLSITLLEIMVFNFIRDKGFDIRIEVDPNTIRPNISERSFAISPLKILNEFKDNTREFLDAFNRSIRNVTHFRRIYPYNASPSVLSTWGDEIHAFLDFKRKNAIPKKVIDQLQELLVELIGNGIEHSKSDVLIDIDITGSTFKLEDYDTLYYAISISVVNLSDTLYHEAVKEKIALIDDDLLLSGRNASRYKYIKQAFQAHAQYFYEQKYTEQDFWTMAGLQKSISGRENNFQSGGRGSVQLIKVLQSLASNNTSYLLSGKRILNFENELLSSNEDDWIGFNTESNFLNKPDFKIFSEPNFNLPGTAYNFQFVYSDEEATHGN